METAAKAIQKGNNMKKYETIHLVKSEDLNHHGTLFAARAAAWFVEAGFAVAACEYGSTSGIVCRNLHSMSFSRPIQQGSVVKFCGRVVQAGNTSLLVYVWAEDAMSGVKAVEGCITFVTLNEETRQKAPHGIILDEPQDEEEVQQREIAQKLLQGNK